MVEFYHSTCKLNIACNPKIGMRGWQALCRMLRKTPCMTYLDARRTLLTDMTMPTFGRCLKADPPLKILHLEGVYLTGRPMLILSKIFLLSVFIWLFRNINRGGYRPCESCDSQGQNCLVYINLGDMVKKLGKNRNFHIVRLTLHPSWIYKTK